MIFASKGCQSPVRGPMRTECIPGQLEFEGFDGRRVVAAFDGGAVTSDAGTVLLREADRAIGLMERVAACFTDHREAEQVVHALPTLIGQRIVAIALGYEDINDHDALRRDPVLALFSDQLEAKRKDCAPLAGKSTINRLAHAPREGGDRYHKIGHDPQALERVFIDVFLDAYGPPPEQIVLDLDATDDPLHGHQEGRFFHGYSYEASLRQAGCSCLSFVMAIRVEPGSPTRPKIRVQLISGAATHLADNHDPSCNSGMAGSRSEWDHSTTRRLVESQITVRSRIHPGATGATAPAAI